MAAEGFGAASIVVNLESMERYVREVYTPKRYVVQYIYIYRYTCKHALFLFFCFLGVAVFTERMVNSVWFTTVMASLPGGLGTNGRCHQESSPR